VQGYRIYYKDLCDDSEDAEFKFVPREPRDTSFSFTPIRPDGVGDSFEIYVTAKNDDCESEPSNIFEFSFIELAPAPVLSVRE